MIIQLITLVLVFFLRLPVDPGTWSLLRIHRERPRRTRRLRHRVTTTRGGRGGCTFCAPRVHKIVRARAQICKFRKFGGRGGYPPRGAQNPDFGGEGPIWRNRTGVGGKVWT